MTFRLAVLTPIILAAVVPSAIAGCSREGDEPTRAAATGTPAEPTGVPLEETPIRVRVNGTTIAGTIHHNPTGSDLLSRLPVTVRVRDHNRQEKTGPLPAPLTMDGMPSGDAPKQPTSATSHRETTSSSTTPMRPTGAVSPGSDDSTAISPHLLTNPGN